MSLSFDLGPSFMDEVMRAITDPKKEPSSTTAVVAVTDEKSPLIEKDVRFPTATFDNAAMTTGGHDTSTDTETDAPRDNGFMDSSSSMSSKASDDVRREDDRGRSRQKPVSGKGKG